MTSSTNILILTDLDGTLLDGNYSWQAASEALSRLKELRIPLVLCSSKTRAEIELYQKKMGLRDPFISEDGGGIFIPKDYFDFEFGYTTEKDGYKIVELGTPYEEIRRAFKELGLHGFGDMTAEEVAEDTGLSLEEARLAKMREYDEAFHFDGDVDGLRRAVEERGLRLIRGGHHWHLTGDNDKGKATKILIDLYSKKCSVKTVGIGDAPNDFPMLRAVDVPILVQKEGDSYADLDLPDLTRAEGVGPAGWNRVVLDLLEDFY